MGEVSAMADIMSTSVSYTGRYRSAPNQVPPRGAAACTRTLVIKGSVTCSAMPPVAVKPTCPASTCRAGSLGRAPTYFGPVNLWIESAAATGSIAAKIEITGDRRPQTLLLRLRHTDKKLLRSVTVNGADWLDFDAAKEWVRIPNPAAQRYTFAGPLLRNRAGASQFLKGCHTLPCPCVFMVESSNSSSSRACCESVPSTRLNQS